MATRTESTNGITSFEWRGLFPVEKITLISILMGWKPEANSSVLYIIKIKTKHGFAFNYLNGNNISSQRGQ